MKFMIEHDIEIQNHVTYGFICCNIERKATSRFKVTSTILLTYAFINCISENNFHTNNTFTNSGFNNNDFLV